MAQLRPTQRTTPTMRDFARALLLVWPEATKEGAGVLWSHFAGETGSGKYCWNWNLGNVKHVPGDGHDWIRLGGVWEGLKFGDEDGDGDVDGEDRELFIHRMIRSGFWTLDPSASQQAAVGPTKVSMIATDKNTTKLFRAYPSLEVGMASFVEMKRRPGGRYFSSWQYVLAGNPEEYGRELGRKGYYTADQNVYALSMRRMFTPWMQSDAFDVELGSIDLDDTQPVAVPVMREDPLGKVMTPIDFPIRRYDRGPGEPPDDAA